MLLPQIVKAQLENILPPELNLLKEKDVIAFDLVSRCLANLESRITLAEIFKHPYLMEELMKSPDMVRESVEGSAASNAPGSSIVLSGTMVPAFSRGSSLGVANTMALVESHKINSNNNSNSNNNKAVARRSIKCYFGPKSSEALCVRVWLDGVSSLDELRSLIESDFREQQSLFADHLSLRYRDADNDLVVITSRTTLEEVLEYAVNLELHAKSSTQQSSSLLGDLLRN
jgi:serine/threonine protein kinase